MKLKLVSIYDAKAEVYSAPIGFPTLGMAERSFVDEVNNPQSNYNKHPEDFTLFHVGDYDQTTGQTENRETPYSLGVALVFKKTEPIAS